MKYDAIHQAVTNIVFYFTSEQFFYGMPNEIKQVDKKIIFEFFPGSDFDLRKFLSRYLFEKYQVSMEG